MNKQKQDYCKRLYTFTKIAGVKFYNAQQFAGYMEERGQIISVKTARRFIRAIGAYRVGRSLLVNEAQIKNYFKSKDSNIDRRGGLLGDSDITPREAWNKGEEYRTKEIREGALGVNEEIIKSTAWYKYTHKEK